ncbi:hypothetical protein Clacol_009533 [Clathrus columnatus]|uniref:HMG box domain-containing protein n=1 Tax=Clathrus columnatus TaxID=1419009 RepID=A0AAV5AKR3_9AGAM|nr:hypothetical protein Clacol_009533 [Clathrus columnatus]
MPPVRTESLNSAVQIEMPYLVPSRGITFAPNIAAETYNEPPELIVPPESTLFPSTDPSSNEFSSISRKSSHSKKRPDDWIPRPPNAFILFRSEFIKRQHVPGDVEANHGNLSKIIGLCWRNLPFSERDVWECKARIAMAEHKAKYPNYRFRPTHKDREPIHRRRVKEPPPPPDEQRCAEIANLLVCGMKGEVLANKVRELDAIRPQERMRMRFDEPVTPSTTVFKSDKEPSLEKVEDQAKRDEGEKETLKEKRRRSSSAPVPEAVTVESEDTKFIPHTPGRQSRRARTVSTTPRNRAASSSPVKKRLGRNRGYSLRIDTANDGGGETDHHKEDDETSHAVYVGVFPTSKKTKQGPSVKEVDDDLSPSELSQEAAGAQDGPREIVEQTGILSPPFTPSDDVFSSVESYSWTQAANALEQTTWTPDTPPTSGQTSWTPHTPNLQNLYLDSPLNSPNSNSPFMSAQPIYMPYTTPLTPAEQYSSAQYPQSPYPPPTPTSPDFTTTTTVTTSTHAPIPRQPYIDIPNLTSDFFNNELLQEHIYNYAAEFGCGEFDTSAEPFNAATSVYDSGENLIFTPEVQNTLRSAAADLQLYRSSAVLINNTHSPHNNHIINISGDNHSADIKSRPLGDDTGAQPLPVAY